ncbi:MAG: hypothetical protein OXE79_06455 [Acidimicrobiaceae bacterium]|nr:hypothetical protein [Acidimicrobiaceae bacterium]
MSSGWIIGYLIGGGLVLVVVVLLLLMIRGAHRAAVQAGAILAALQESRDNTAVLWAVNDVNSAIERISSGAGAVREHLIAGSGASANGGRR